MRKLILVALAVSILGSIACDRTINEVRAPLPQQPLASTHP